MCLGDNLSFFGERIPPFTANVKPTTATRTTFISNPDIYVELCRHMAYTEAVTPPT